MKKYVIKSEIVLPNVKGDVIVEVVSFDELIEYGRVSGANIINGMPWSFTYRGFPITHENDECYLIPTPNGIDKFKPGEFLVTLPILPNGELFVFTEENFLECFEPLKD